MASDLDKLYLRYATDPTMLDGLFEAVHGTRTACHYPGTIARRKMRRRTSWSRSGGHWPRFTRQSTFRTFVHTVAVNHLHDLASATKCRIEEVPTEDLPEHAHQEGRCDRFPLDRFAEDERDLLTTFARHLHFGKAAAELGITPKALRSRLERLKARQQMEDIRLLC